MSTNDANNSFAIPGSARPAVGQVAGPANPDATAQVTLVLRRKAPLPADTALTLEQLDSQYGASPQDIALVTKAAHDAGLRVLAVHRPSRRIRVEGTIADLEKAFGTRLMSTRIGDGEYRTRTGELSIPEQLKDVVVAVLGLDNRPQAAARHLVAKAEAVATSYTPIQLADIYAMPQADGTGETIAIIELGGGFGQSDLTTYFGQIGVATPTVTAVGVDGATNVAGKDPQGADGEVLLDIEVAGAIAPKAQLVVYFAPNTDAGFLDAIATAAHATPTPAAISISWGQSEDQWTAQARTAMDSAFADATALGAVVLVAAGDNGSSDAGTGVHVDFPASSPNAIGCGGTSLRISGSSVTETVWNDGGQGGATGGGVSDAFALPSWQTTAGVPDRSGTTSTGRGVPDVAGNADPQTGYQVFVDGQSMVIGGTSAVAPLWAGLVARLTQLAGKRIGPLQSKLYAAVTPGHGPTGLRDITSGSNGAYSAGPGWDACTGLGVPTSGVAKLLDG